MTILNHKEKDGIEKKKEELLEWQETVLGDINWGFNNLPDRLEGIFISNKFSLVCLNISSLYLTGAYSFAIDGLASKDKKTISAERMIKIAEIRIEFIQVIQEKIKDINFFYKTEFVSKNYRKVFPAPKWMEGTIFEEVWLVFWEYITLGSIKMRELEFSESPKWSLQMRIVDSLREMYLEEIEKQKSEIGSVEPILELRLELIEGLFQCLEKEEEIKNEYLAKSVEANNKDEEF